MPLTRSTTAGVRASRRIVAGYGVAALVCMITSDFLEDWGGVSKGFDLSLSLIPSILLFSLLAEWKYGGLLKHVAFWAPVAVVETWNLAWVLVWSGADLDEHGMGDFYWHCSIGFLAAAVSAYVAVLRCPVPKSP